MNTNVVLRQSGNIDSILKWGSMIEAKCREVEEISSTPNTTRTMRPFRYSDALQFLGVPNVKWRDWILANVAVNERPSKEFMLSNEEYWQMMDDLGYTKRRPNGAKTLRLLTQQFKGGSQKTSLSIHLAHFLALRGYKVLCIDSDPQGTLTRMFGLSPQLVESENTIGSIFEAMRDGEDVSGLELKPIKSHICGLDILAANLDMSGADIDIAASLMKQTSKEPFYLPLSRALEKIEDEYDVVIIDSPPSFSFMAICLAWYANGMIIPMPAEVPDFAATGDFCRLFGSYMGITEQIGGVKKTWDPIMVVHGKISGTQSSDFVLSEASGIFGHSHIKAGIKQSQPIINSLSLFKSVFEASYENFDRRGLNNAREMYIEFGKEVEKGIMGSWERQVSEMVAP